MELKELPDVTIGRNGDSPAASIARGVIRAARNEGFVIEQREPGTLPRVRHMSQLANQPSDGTDAGNKAKMAAEQYSGPVRQLSATLSSMINNNRVAISAVLLAHNAQVAAYERAKKGIATPTLEVTGEAPGYAAAQNVIDSAGAIDPKNRVLLDKFSQQQMDKLP